MKQLLLSLSLFSLLLLGACNQDTEGPGGESPHDPVSRSFTFIDPISEECIIGPDDFIHQDSIRLFDENMNEIPVSVGQVLDLDRWYISALDVQFQDSFYQWDAATSIYETTFYILLNNTDYDTVRMQVDPDNNFEVKAWYNESNNIQEGTTDESSSYASYFFRKTITLN